jgi:hypothetical protein
MTTVPTPQYASPLAPGIIQVGAIQTDTSINNTSMSLTFFVTVNTIGNAVIDAPLLFRLRVILRTSTGVTQVFVNPSVKDGLKKTFYGRPTGESGEIADTIDNNSVFPLRHIAGHLYFTFTKTADQSLVSQDVELIQP